MTDQRPGARPRPTMTANDVRQGGRGARVFTILMVSLVLVIVAMGILLAWQQVALRDDPPRGAVRSQTQPPAATATPPPQQTAPATR